MNINNRWRNKQLGTNILQQEALCYKFLNQHNSLTWAWHGTRGNFYNFCQQQFNFSENATGLVIINLPVRATPREFVEEIDSLITESTQAVYLAVNRFEFKSSNDLGIQYPDSLEQSIDLIVQHCCVPFQRINHSTPVDGHHFVGAHGLDIFVYEHH